MSKKVVSRSSGEQVEVSSRDAQDAVLRNDAVLPETSQTVVKGDQILEIPTENLSRAVDLGWKLVDEQEAHGVQVRREESDFASGTLGALERGASGVTMGLSDYAATKLGADPERMSARKEALGGFGTAIEIGAAAAPAFFSGGGSLLGRAATATPAGALELGSAALAKLAGRALPPKLARVAVPTAQGMIEGFAGGAGAEISEASLGNREILADRVLASGAMTAVLGGGMGLSLPIVTSAARSALPISAQAVQTILRRGAGDAVQEVAEAGKPGVLAKAIAASNGADPAKIQKGIDRLRSPAGRVNLAMGQQEHAAEIAKLGRELGTNIDELNDAVGIGLRHTEGRAKFMEGVGMPDGADVVAPRAAAKAMSTAEGHLTSFENDVAKFGSDFIGTSTREARLILETTQNKLVDAKTARETMRAIDEGQTQLRQLTQKLRAERGADPRLAATAKRIDEIRASLRDHTYDERVYGEAARLSKQGDAMQAAAIQARTSVPGKRSAAQRVLARDEATTADDLITVARKFGRQGQGSMEDSIDTVFRKELDYMEWLAKNREMPPEFQKALAESKAKFAKLEESIAKNRERVDDLDLMKYFRSVEGGDSVSIGLTSNMGATVGAGIGGSMFGPLGAAAGAAAGRALTSPYTTFRTLAGLLNLAEKTAPRIKSTIDKFLARTDAPVVKAAGRSTAKPLDRPRSARIVAAVGAAKALEEQRTKHNSIRERAAYLSTNPTALADELQHALMEIDEAAPGLAGTLRHRMQNAATYLNSKAPVVFDAPFGKHGPMIDSIAAAAYARRVEAVEDPIKALGLLAEGRLTVEHVEAIKAVYPQLYEEVREKVFEKLSEASANGKTVPLGVRMQAAILFDAPTDATLQPEILRQLQPVAAPQPEQGGAPANLPRPRAAGASPEAATRYDTPATRIERGVSG